jgi:hypothetical protein
MAEAMFFTQMDDRDFNGSTHQDPSDFVAKVLYLGHKTVDFEEIQHEIEQMKKISGFDHEFLNTILDKQAEATTATVMSKIVQEVFKNINSVD